MSTALRDQIFGLIGPFNKKGVELTDATTFAGDLEWDSLTVMDFVAAIEDECYVETTRRAVIHTREGLALQLEDLGFEVLPSQTNFLFVRHPAHDAAQLAAALRAVGILVRHFRTPRIAQYLRISIGTPTQCDALVADLQRILAA